MTRGSVYYDRSQQHRPRSSDTKGRIRANVGILSQRDDRSADNAGPYGWLGGKI